METWYRSLADQLRAWSDEQLTRLLAARPDLTTPAPLDSAQLASRAQATGGRDYSIFAPDSFTSSP